MRLVGAIAAALLLTSCGAERWRAVVYPSKYNLIEHLELGDTTSLQRCRAVSLQVIKALPDPDKATYECALNCAESNGLGGPLICERTER